MHLLERVLQSVLVRHTSVLRIVSMVQIWERGGFQRETLERRHQSNLQPILKTIYGHNPIIIQGVPPRGDYILSGGPFRRIISGAGLQDHHDRRSGLSDRNQSAENADSPWAPALTTPSNDVSQVYGLWSVRTSKHDLDEQMYVIVANELTHRKASERVHVCLYCVLLTLQIF